jgi:hypothetical protein
LSQHSCSFDHLIGTGEKRWRDGKANFLSGFEVDDQSEFRRLFNREIGGLGPLGDTGNIIGSAPVQGRDARAVRQQAIGS